MTKLDEDLLKQIAAITNGIYVRSVSGDMDLDAVYTNEIRAKMDKAEFSSGRKQVWEDRFQWLLILSVIALIAEMFVPSTKKGSLIMVLVSGQFL